MRRRPRQPRRPPTRRRARAASCRLQPPQPPQQREARPPPPPPSPPHSAATARRPDDPERHPGARRPAGAAGPSAARAGRTADRLESRSFVPAAHAEPRGVTTECAGADVPWDGTLLDAGVTDDVRAGTTGELVTVVGCSVDTGEVVCRVVGVEVRAGVDRGAACGAGSGAGVLALDPGAAWGEGSPACPCTAAACAAGSPRQLSARTATTAAPPILARVRAVQEPASVCPPYRCVTSTRAIRNGSSYFLAMSSEPYACRPDRSTVRVGVPSRAEGCVCQSRREQNEQKG